MENPSQSPPTQLIACASDPTKVTGERDKCVLELFRDHVKPGLSFDELLGWGPMVGLFDARSLFDANKYASVPVGRTQHDSVFMFKPSFLEPKDSAIYIRLSKPIRLDELFDLIARRKRDEELKILEIGFSQTPESVQTDR